VPNGDDNDELLLAYQKGLFAVPSLYWDIYSVVISQIITGAEYQKIGVHVTATVFKRMCGIVCAENV
jgi:hypothetical protein